LKIVLGTFKDNADELAEFLGPRVGGKPVVSGGEMEFDDESVKKTVKPRHVKTYVKRFLNRKGERQNYQILVTGTELRMIELEREEKEEEERKKEKASKETKEEAADEKKETEEAASEQKAESAEKAS